MTDEPDELKARMTVLEAKMATLEQALADFPVQMLKGFQEAFKDNDWNAVKDKN